MFVSYVKNSMYGELSDYWIENCVECGACAYVCPSSIPLVHYYRHAKGEIRKQKLEQQKSDHARLRFEARQERLEREQQEKEAKRRARAEAAAKAQEAKAKAAEQQDTATSSPSDKDPKKAAVAAALERAKAKQPNTGRSADPSEQMSPEEAKQALDKARNKLEKMLDALENAKQNTPDQVEKLTRAVEKNQLRVNQAKQTWEKANEAQTTSTLNSATPDEQGPSVAELEQQLDKARAKLEKMEDALATAKNEQPELVEKLSRAVEKNQVRVKAAEGALHEAQNKNTGAGDA